MTTPILPPYVPPFKPVPQVTPFTYRDGITMLKKLDGLGSYINKVLIPFVNDNYSDLANEFEEEINRLIEIIVNDSIEVQDPLVAALIADIDSLTRQALEALDYVTLAETDDRYTAHVVWDGATYPARVPDAINIFFGPVDPGLLMGPGDYWANPDVTTISEIISELNSTTSALTVAVKKSVTPTVFDLHLEKRSADTSLVLKDVGLAGAELYGWEMVDAVTTGLSAILAVPYGWNSARVRVWYFVPAGSGAFTLSRDATAFKTGTAPVVAGPVSNTFTATVGTISNAYISGDIILTGMSSVSVIIKRVGSAGGDTLASPMYILGARLDKVS